MNKFIPLIRWLIVLIVVLVLLGAFKDIIIKSAIEIASPNLIGVKVEMGSFSLGILTHKIHIKNLRVYNPPGFPTQVFFAAPEVTLDADIPELIKGKMHFPLVVLNMEKMVIFKDKEGKLNVDSIKIIQEQQAANKGKPLKLPVFKIDMLELNIGKVIVEDYTHAPPALVEAYDVNIKDKKISNINGLPKLVAAIIIEAMKPTAIHSAGVYAAEAVLGVGFLPALAIDVAIAKDDADAELNHSFDSVYQESLKLVQDLGSVKNADQKSGQITAKVYGCDITISILDSGWNKSYIKIKARKYMLAKFEIANGLLYQLNDRLK